MVSFLRGTVNEDQTFSVNPMETRGRSLESMELTLKALTEPQPFGWEGRFYQFRTVAVWPRPLQRPLPPTYVLTRSPESAEFAARHHLGLGVSFAPVQTTAEVTNHYRSMCADHGWEPTEDDLLFRYMDLNGLRLLAIFGRCQINLPPCSASTPHAHTCLLKLSP